MGKAEGFSLLAVGGWERRLGERDQQIGSLGYRADVELLGVASVPPDTRGTEEEEGREEEEDTSPAALAEGPRSMLVGFTSPEGGLSGLCDTPCFRRPISV